MIEWLTNPCVLFMLAGHALFAFAAWAGSVQPGPEPEAPSPAELVQRAAFAGFYPSVILALPLLALREVALARYPSLPAGSAAGALAVSLYFAPRNELAALASRASLAGAPSSPDPCCAGSVPPRWILQRTLASQGAGELLYRRASRGGLA